LIFLTGIAGGIPSLDFTLGDVVVANRLHDFSVGALLEGAAPELTNQGGPMTKTVQDLLALLPALEGELAGWESEGSVGMARPSVSLLNDALYGEESWKSRTRTSLEFHFNGSSRSYPKALTGAIASSGNLIKDSTVAAHWRRSARDLLAMEMELTGVYAAADRKYKTYSVIAVRGISDIVGFKRDDAWTRYACETAGSFCISLLKNMPAHFIWDAVTSE
jgi:nucleoside phosphorylase